MARLNLTPPQKLCSTHRVWTPCGRSKCFTGGRDADVPAQQGEATLHCSSRFNSTSRWYRRYRRLQVWQMVVKNRGGFQSLLRNPNSWGLVSTSRPPTFGGARARSLVWRLTFIGIALALDGCASPDRSDYAAAAAQHADWAQKAREGAAEDEAAARSAAAQGNEARANDLKKEELEFSKRAQLEQFRADKNKWLSQWWPSLSNP